MPNPLQRYVEIATGLTTATVQTAERVVQRLVQEGEVAADRAERAVADVLDASQRNRAVLMDLVRGEVERAVVRLNLATHGDLEAMEQRLLAHIDAAVGPDTADGPLVGPGPGIAPGEPRRRPRGTGAP